MAYAMGAIVAMTCSQQPCGMSSRLSRPLTIVSTVGAGSLPGRGAVARGKQL